MKKIKTLLLAGYSIALLTGCSDKTFKSLEIAEYPKTTFYCGEQFTNTGISVKVNFSDGSYEIREDVTTTKPTTMMVPGKQTVKAYFTDEKYGINTWVNYDITIIDWTREEKAIFDETSIAQYSGVYYPKMDGMKIVSTLSDVDGSIIDYYIELENSSAEQIDQYIELLNEYDVTKTMSYSGQSIDFNFKFYQQRSVPVDFKDKYSDLRNCVCFRYCASYEYVDATYGAIYNLYALEGEDTLVIGLDDNNNMIIRYIPDSVYIEALLSAEVNTHLAFDGLYLGTAIDVIKKDLIGYTNEEGKFIKGSLNDTAPLATQYIIFPEAEIDVVSIANYNSMNPWTHVDDDFCFEVELSCNDIDEYEEYIALLDAKTDFVKTTRTDKIGGKDVEIHIYTIENKEYVGNITIEVSDYIDDGLSYYTTNQETGERNTVNSGCYFIYYRFQRPESISPVQDELFRIYDAYYGKDNYGQDDYYVEETGEMTGLVKFPQYRQTEAHPTKGEYEVESSREAVELFANTFLSGYSCTKEPTEEEIGGYDAVEAQYANDDFVIDILGYFYGSGKYAVQFKISSK